MSWEAWRFQAIWTGRPDEGLTLTEHALIRADHLTATERAILHTTRARARALATMRRVHNTLIAVGTADDHFAHSTPANDPPFVAHYDTAHYAGVTTMITGDPVQAAVIDTTALDQAETLRLHRTLNELRGLRPSPVRALVVKHLRSMHDRARAWRPGPVDALH